MSFLGAGKINCARLLAGRRRWLLLCFLLSPTPSRSVGPAALFGRLLINCRAWMKFHQHSNRKSPGRCSAIALRARGEKRWTMLLHQSPVNLQNKTLHILSPLFASSCQMCLLPSRARERFWPSACVQISLLWKQRESNVSLYKRNGSILSRYKRFCPSAYVRR